MGESGQESKQEAVREDTGRVWKEEVWTGKMYKPWGLVLRDVCYKQC
jgi:hypothetical protein